MKTTRRYGIPITQTAPVLDATGFVPTTGDPVQDVLVLTAVAYQRLEQLRQAGMDAVVVAQMARNLEGVYRMALQVRVRQPRESLTEQFLTRFGRLSVETEI